MKNLTYVHHQYTVLIMQNPSCGFMINLSLSLFLIVKLNCLLCFAVKSTEAEKEMEQVNIKPNVDVRLSDLKLVLGPELRIVYPLILNFAVSGELEVNGMAHPKWIKPKGILTFENGDVNLVATQVSPMSTYALCLQISFC